MNLFQLNDFENEDLVSVDEFALEYKDWMDNSDLLKTSGFLKQYTSDGTFKSDTWIILNELTQTHSILDFTEFEELIFKKCITKEDITIIKCWIASKFQENYSIPSIFQRLKNLKFFIFETDNFDSKLLNSNKGDVIFTLIKKHNITGKECYHLKEYLDFLDAIGLIRDEHLQVVTSLDNISMPQDSNPRSLPSNKDILSFEYYLKRFFNEEKEQSITNYYRPLLLWWKITTVIPMRASEFAFKLKRDCLINNNGEYYLKVDRIKVRKAKRTVGRIPILNKIGITKEIYDLISEYIELTSFDSNTKTLISYEAILKFRKDYSNSEDTRYNLRYHAENKGNTTSSTLRNLATLLNSFYKVVIEGFYGDNTISDYLTPGDTRHLAFSSLALQGLNPIEIAMLGGHTSLSAQDNYTGHVNYYVDSEILSFVNNRNIPKEISDKNLIKIIFSKPETCPKLLVDCHKTEDGVGYCTLDINNDPEYCDNVPNCIYCRKWWCEPNNRNYLKAKYYLENSEIEPLKATIKEEENFLLKLLNHAKTVNISGLLELDKEYEEQISTARLKLKSNVDKLIMLKKSLLEYTEYNNKIEGE